MCGIAGLLSKHQPADRAIVEAMVRTLDHRGPDSWGIFASGAGAIGQTRLAIIDLVTGDPPIALPDDSLGVALNGEIYNFAELRAELERDGHRFRTQGDTEVILHLAEHLDPVALARRLAGMFAFAVWDPTRGRLVIGRDRLGKKPLYWWQGGGSFVFGSEIKTLLAHPRVPRDLDPDAIPAFLRFGYVPTPRTFFAGIRSVPPGHVLVVEPDHSLHLEPYWQPSVPGMNGTTRLDVSADEAARLVRDELGKAVRRRLVADVPLGAFLSGGIDSSAIVALMAAETDRPVRTFTIGFDDADGFDERPWAHMVAERFATEHTEFVVTPKAVDLVERLVWHHDQPFGDSSAIPTYLLSELTREHVTVALCGDGGDELFAGYERFAAGVAAHALGRLPSGAGRALGATAAAGASLTGRVRAAKVRRFAGVASLGLPDAMREWVGVTPDHLVKELTGRACDWSVADYHAVWDASAGAAPLDRLLLLNLRTYLVDDLLPKVDRTSMAHGLEVRAPFLDHELVELALRLPPSTKMRGTTLKRCLKLAMADLLPAEILNRRKRGFGVPLGRWFRDDLSSYVDATLTAPGARVGAHLDPTVVAALVAEHRSGAADHGHILWSLLTLEVFLRERGW